MNLVVDANILFAALIKDSISYEILVFGKFHFFTPEYIFQELVKHKEEILNKTKRSKKEFYIALGILKEKINIVPLTDLIEYLPRAQEICPDPNDEAYFTLALKLNCAIWSNDKELKNQNKIKVYSTKDLLEVI